MPPCRRAGAALPGRFAETLDSCPTGQLDFFFTVVPPQDDWIFFSQLSAEGSNPGVTTGLKEATLGPRSHWQKKRAAVLPPQEDWNFFPGKNPGPGRRRLGRLEAPMPGRFAETVGLDDSFEFFFLGRIPTLGSAGLRCRAGAAGRLGAAGTKPNPHSPPGPCYMCYMCYISQGKPLISQATEHPLSPGSLLYVLYVLYLKPLNIHSPRFLAICAICAIWPYIAHILQIFARTEYIAHIVHIARSWGRVGVQRLGV